MSAIMRHDMKAILGEDFFKEEVRCDYLISSEMKRVFAVGYRLSSKTDNLADNRRRAYVRHVYQSNFCLS